jgi:hypothetical protein
MFRTSWPSSSVQVVVLNESAVLLTFLWFSVWLSLMFLLKQVAWQLKITSVTEQQYISQNIQVDS